MACLLTLGLFTIACGGSTENVEGPLPAPTDSTEEATTAVVSPTPVPAPTEVPADPAPTPTAIPTAIPAVPLADLIPAFDTLGARAAVEGDAVAPAQMCPGWDQLDGLSPVEVATRTFRGDRVLGPFLTIGLFDFPEGEADQYLDAHIDGAAGPCAQFTTPGATGNTLTLAWSETTGVEYGDRTVNFAVRGDSDGFPVNSDVVLIRVGDQVGYVGYLTIGTTPDAATRDAAAAAIVRSLGGENVGTVSFVSPSQDIAEALPGLDELGNPELIDEAVNAALPDGQCPDNPSTLTGLTVVAAAARRFLRDQDRGPHVTVSILEMAEGDADEFIDRWVAGAAGPCTSYIAAGLDFGWSVGSGPEYLDRTVTLFARGFQRTTTDPASADYVLVRSGNFVGYLHYFLVGATEPDQSVRDTMVEALVEALEEVSNS